MRVIIACFNFVCSLDRGWCFVIQATPHLCSYEKKHYDIYRTKTFRL